MDDLEFLTKFEAGSWPFDQWHHREHIKLAYLYLSQFPFEQAIEKMRMGVKSYTAANHVPESPTSGYHETITLTWMHLVHLTLCEFGPRETADAFVDTHTRERWSNSVARCATAEYIISLK